MALNRVLQSNEPWRAVETDMCLGESADVNFRGQGEVFGVPLFVASESVLNVRVSGSGLVDVALFVLRVDEWNDEDLLISNTFTIVAEDDDGGLRGLPLLENIALSGDEEYAIFLTSWHGQAVGDLEVTIEVLGDLACEEFDDPFVVCVEGCIEEDNPDSQECFDFCAESACIEECIGFGEPEDRCIQNCTGPPPEWAQECIVYCDENAEQFFGACIEEIEDERFCVEQTDEALVRCFDQDCVCFHECREVNPSSEVCANLCF